MLTSAHNKRSILILLICSIVEASRVVFCEFLKALLEARLVYSHRSSNYNAQLIISLSHTTID
jgi:hypothetical protein